MAVPAPIATQLEIFRIHEAYRARQALTIPWQAVPRIDFEPVAQWPPHTKRRKDTFKGKRPVDHRLGQWEQYKRIPNPPVWATALTTAENKHRFRKAIEMAERLTIIYKRILGHGGQAVVSLFEVEWDINRSNTPPDYLAVKMCLDLNAQNDLANERAVMDTLARSEHIIKGYGLFDIVNTNPLGLHIFSANPDPGTPPAQKLGPLVITEYMPLGSLDGQLRRLTTTNVLNGATRRFLEEETWRIFRCLARACVAMKYPPRMQAANGPVPSALAGNPLPETIPPGAARALGDCNIIHFDLDPKNIFLGVFPPPPGPAAPIAPGGHAHVRAPIFKVADFGLAKQWIPPLTTAIDPVNGLPEVWRLRVVGKREYWSPEQWTLEWDGYSGIPTAPGGEPPQVTRPQVAKGPSEIAGRYDEKTNIFQVGLTMLSAMTGSLPPWDGPWAEPVRIWNPLGTGSPGGPARTIAGMTHAWQLNSSRLERGSGRPPTRWSHFPDRLRDVVMQCAMHHPADRPDLESLVAECDAQVAALDAAAPPGPLLPALAAFNEPMPPANYQPLYGDGTNIPHTVGSDAWYQHTTLDLQNQVLEYEQWMNAVGLMT